MFTGHEHISRAVMCLQQLKLNINVIWTGLILI